MTRSRGIAIIGALLLAPGLCVLGRAGWIELKGEVAEVLIERALEASLADGQSRPPWAWADMHPVARLTVPRLSVMRPILSNASGPALAFGLGHVDGTAAPASSGNSVIAGHRDSWASFLADLRTGDEIVVEAPGRRSVYRVASTAIVRFDDGSVLRDEGEQLTLVTCWPFRGWIALTVAICDPLQRGHRSRGAAHRCAELKLEECFVKSPVGRHNALHGENT